MMLYKPDWKQNGKGYLASRAENFNAHVKYRRDDIDVNNYDDDVKGWQVGMGYKFSLKL